MAASRSSLSLTPPTPPPPPSSPPGKRRPPHLPLPTSNFSVAPVQRLQESGTSLGRSKSVGESRNNKDLARSGSSTGKQRELSLRDPPVSSPPTIATFQIPPAPSATHAGGILPSASFFRPSRPLHSRPSTLSMASNEALHTTNAPPPDQYPLTLLARPPSHDSNLGNISDPGSLRGPSVARSKQSRDPLIPASSRQIPNGPSPSLRSPASLEPLHKHSSGTRVRSSVERVFRGFSFDSFRNKSNGSPHTSRLSSTEQSHGPVDDARSSAPYLPHRHPPVELSSSGPSSCSPTPNQMFVADVPKTKPPLSAVPLTPRVRRYRKHPSRNTFFCWGHMMTGGDSPWAFVVSLTLLCVISGVWFGNTCVWWWQNQSPAVAAIGAYMCLLTISTMLATAFRDPGILPRDLDPDPPFPSTSPSDGGVRAPIPRDLKVRNDYVRVKYCATCKTYRPPRSSHCKMCDNCVDGCDHHCQWVNNCIGRRNYTFFFSFLLSAVLTLCLVICTSAIHLYLITQRDHVDFERALDRGIGSAIAFLLSILVIWPVVALLAYHMRLLFLNVTTIEQIRFQAHKTLEPGVKPPNPFSYGSWRSNVAEVLCRPAGYSWLDARAYVTQDKRRPNPGLEDGWEDLDLERGEGTR